MLYSYIFMCSVRSLFFALSIKNQSLWFKSGHEAWKAQLLLNSVNDVYFCNFCDSKFFSG